MQEAYLCFAKQRTRYAHNPHDKKEMRKMYLLICLLVLHRRGNYVALDTLRHQRMTTHKEWLRENRDMHTYVGT